jgi:hypothetical protein
MHLSLENSLKNCNCTKDYIKNSWGTSNYWKNCLEDCVGS